MDNNQAKLTSMAVMVIEKFDNDILAAFNVAIQTSGKIEKINKSYKTALDTKLINESGYPYDAKITCQNHTRKKCKN